MDSGHISVDDAVSLLDAVRRLGALDSLADLRVGICRELHAITGAAQVWVDSFDLGQVSGEHHQWPPVSAQEQALRQDVHRRLAAQHPLLREHLRRAHAGEPDAEVRCLSASEAAEAAEPNHEAAEEFAASDLCTQFYRPRGIGDQASFALSPRPGQATIVTICSGGEFDAIARAGVEALRPHVVNLDRLMWWREHAVDDVIGSEDDRRVEAAIGRIATAQSGDDFARAVARELFDLVPGVWATYNVTSLEQGTTFQMWPDIQVAGRPHDASALDEYADQSPVIRHVVQTGGESVVTLREVDPEGTFFDTALHRTYYRPHGIMNQAAFGLPATDGVVVAVVVNRGNTDFTVAELRLMNQFRRRLVLVHRAISEQERSRELEQTLALNGWEFATVGADGEVLESTEGAVVLGRRLDLDLMPGGSGAERLAEFVEPHDLAVSGPWFRTVALTSIDDPVQAALTLHVAGPHTLWLREVGLPDAELLASLGLTQRQAEVALEVAKGATNRQIAAALQISVGTVRKHIEMILQTLGLDSRTAVATLIAQHAHQSAWRPDGQVEVRLVSDADPAR